jgi:hypothetical protein
MPTYTLQQLKERIEEFIKYQGADAPVAAFVYTQENVDYQDLFGVQTFSDEFITKVLNNVCTFSNQELIQRQIDGEVSNLMTI